MSAGSDAYVRALYEARRRAFTLKNTAVHQLRRALTEAANQIAVETAISDNPLTIARGKALRREILAIVDELGKAQNAISTNAVKITAQDVVRIHERITQRLAADSIGSPFAKIAARFDRIPSRVIAVLNARHKNAATFRTLINGHIEDMAPALDRMITAGIARGVSVRELSKDVAKLLEDGYGFAAQKYGLSSDIVDGITSIGTDANRIAVSETLNAMREAQAQAMTVSPVVEAVAWQVSGAHPLEDECDMLAGEDFYGFGPGLYPPDHFPIAPHPNCGCTAGDVELRPVDDWDKPKEDAPPLILERDWQPPRPEGWTDRRHEVARERLLTSLRDPRGSRVRSR